MHTPICGFKNKTLSHLYVHFYTKIRQVTLRARSGPWSLQIGTSKSQKGHEGSKILDFFLISQLNATVANSTQFAQYSG